MNLPSKTLERKLLAKYDYVMGVDEVGVGCLAGPVVVCAVLFGKHFFDKQNKNLYGLRDSKLLLPQQREKFAQELRKIKNLKFQISWCQPRTIDKINIYQAARRAMKRAVIRLTELTEGRPRQMPRAALSVLVDGPRKIDGLNLDQIPVVRGDQKVFAIACASILAKVYRDKLMVGYAKKFPGYGFEKHKGYGTKLHQQRLANLGPCSIHRRSFAPVARLI